MNTLLITVLSPIFGLIVIGYTLKRMHFGDESFWKSLDKLVYYAFMPSLLLYKLATADFDKAHGAMSMVYVVGISLIVLTLFLTLMQLYKKFKPSSYTSIYQGAIRYNTYIYLGIVDGLYGDEGMVLAIFLITFLIPFINLFCVSVFSIYVNDGRFSFRKFLRSIATNPLILACVSGAILNFSGFGLPLGNLIKFLGSPAIPLGLLSVGVGLKIRELSRFSFDFWLSTISKLIVLPFIVVGVGYMFQIDGVSYDIILLFASMPTAISSYILARELGGDLTLMSSLITAQTLLSFLTIAFILSFSL